MNKFMISWGSLRAEKYQNKLLRGAMIAYGAFVVVCYIYTFATL